jgi:hypothetical protein
VAADFRADSIDRDPFSAGRAGPAEGNQKVGELSGPTNPFDQDQCITGHNVLQDWLLPFVLSGARALRACSVKT